MNEDVETKRAYSKDCIIEVLSEWIEDFGDSGYSTSFSSREDDRVQMFPAWGDAEIVPNNGDCILEHAYIPCIELAPGHIINEEKVKAFVEANIK